MKRLLVFSLLLVPVWAQTARRGSTVRVEHYTIAAEVDPRAGTLKAQAELRLSAIEDRVSNVTLEFNDALRITQAADDKGRSIGTNRGSSEFTVVLAMPEPLEKNQATTVRLAWEGRLGGQEESPVFGIRFAALRADHGFLLYPARWFPVADYSAGRHTMSLAVTVPDGYRVIAPGSETRDKGAGKTTFRFETKTAGFPGSLGIVQGDPVSLTENGVTSLFWFRDGKGMEKAYAEEAGKVLAFLTGLYGLPPTSSLALIETEKGAPTGYAAPGILFLSPGGIGKQANSRLMVNQLSRQWWGNMVSHATRNHLWITNGLARYNEVLWIEQANGPGAAELELKDLYIEALTVEQPPLIQASRLEDYSPEFWALTAGKGATVFNMLNLVMGQENFRKLLKTIPDRFANKSINTEDFRKLASEIHGEDLGWFFIEWIESSGAPEFKTEYVVYRTAKGFRINGKVQQDLDTFRMPVELEITTEGNPEFKVVDVAGVSSEFVVETFGKPQKVNVDPKNRVLRFSPEVRTAVAIRRGEQFAELNEFGEALKEYQKALEVNRNSSLAHYRVAELFFLQNNYQSAANEFREALNGDLEPKWVEVWCRINLGKIFDITGQRERAVNEYNLAIRTKDNTQGAQEEAAKYLKEPYKRPARVD
jgi:aminopeptidase N